VNRYSKKAIWGIILIFLGMLLLFDSLDYIDFWEAAGKCWPLILILIGLMILLKRNKSNKDKKDE